VFEASEVGAKHIRHGASVGFDLCRVRGASEKSLPAALSVDMIRSLARARVAFEANSKPDELVVFLLRRKGALTSADRRVA
jgi:hypothetical protein